MIFADTSVWVAALRSATTFEARHLAEALERDEIALSIVVRLEILSGAGSQDRARLRRTLSALPIYYPRGETWDRVEGWIDRASNAGERFGVTDLLVASLAAEHNAELWSLDQDFDRMARLGFIRRYVPR